MSGDPLVERVGLALPEQALPQGLFAEWAQQVSRYGGRGRKLIPMLYRRSGVTRRHSVLLEGEPLRQEFFAAARAPGDRGPGTAARMERYRTEAPRLALRAGRAALGDDRCVTHLVTVSCTGFFSPGFDIDLIRGLELPPDVQRTHVGFMGCHGALNGLRVARALCRAEPDARVLLCAVELCSLHYDYRAGPASIVANGLFSDGAAALVLRNGEGDGWRVTGGASRLIPGGPEAMRWEIGDFGFEMALGADVPDRIGARVGPWLAEWLDGHGLSPAAVGTWAVHPGGPRVLGAVARALALPDGALDDARAVLAECGNMSSATVLFLLDRLMRRDAPRPCVALAFGPGLTAEAALLT